MSTDRKRAQTVSNSSKSKNKGTKKKRKCHETNKIERHSLLLKTVKELGHDMDVFHLRWMPGEYLDKDALESVPMFWFKKFAWQKSDILKLYEAGKFDISKKRKRELRHVFGRGRGKGKRKDSNALDASFFGAIAVQKPATVNESDIYRRTRRLLTTVAAVPSKVRVIDNQSSMNINNAGFPDLQYISDTTEAPPMAMEQKTNTHTAPISDHNLPELSENTEEINYANPNIKGNITPINKPTNNNTVTPNSSSHRKNDSSISTPFGDMDTNTLINLRAKHRRTSSLMNRNSSEFSMNKYSNIVWNKLAIMSGRGETLTQRQFDIELQNNDILADPDICKELFKCIQDREPINRKQINKSDFDRVALELDKIPLIDEINNNTLKDENRIEIILKQVFVHLAQKESFDVSSYMTVKLTTQDLNNVDLLLEYLSSRHKEWTVRLRILKWITANLEMSHELRALTSDLNIGPFLLGWICQCLDERSNLAKSALEMFPNILSIAMTHTGEAFQYLDDIFSSLFLVLRNKRSKDLTETANECCIQCVDMIMDWHEHGELDEEVLLELCCIFSDNTSLKEQKHDKIRERCCAYFVYILYGLNGAEQSLVNDDFEENGMEEKTEENGNNSHEHSVSLMVPMGLGSHILSKSADFGGGDSGKKWTPSPRASIVGQKNLFKISKVMRRKYLLKNAQFIRYMNDAMNNALGDKSGETRQTGFKLIEKLSKETETENILSDVFSIDAFAMSKFEKWKQRKNKKGSKNSKKKKKSNRQRIKKRTHDKKQSVTLTIGAQ